MGQPEPERFSDLTDVPPRLIPPVPPKTELFAKLVGNAFAIAVVGFAIAISLGKIFALRHGYRVDSNQVCDSDHVGTYRSTQAQMTGVRERRVRRDLKVMSVREWDVWDNSQILEATEQECGLEVCPPRRTRRVTWHPWQCFSHHTPPTGAGGPWPQ